MEIAVHANGVQAKDLQSGPFKNRNEGEYHL
jgi:hypothetical protein